MGGGTPFVEPSAEVPVGLSPRGRGNQKATIPAAGRMRSIPAWAGEPHPPILPVNPPEVYPRVGGGTKCCSRLISTASGLSPRGRGNLRALHPALWPPRSIPAWAGEPATSRVYILLTTVYPRVGGGTRRRSIRISYGLGLSPRGRGNHTVIGGVYDLGGSIPAWAGEPASPQSFTKPSTVYPRVGGGTTSIIAFRLSIRGLSPRGRGNHHRAIPSGCGCRSIPAWAGEPNVDALRRSLWKVYPRVGGGTMDAFGQPHSIQGLSPRGRGNPSARRWRRSPGRSIPAWAGEPATMRRKATPRMVYPRVGGGTGRLCAGISRVPGLSPRGRGNRWGIGRRATGRRSIPAWAGEPRTLPRINYTIWVYPRVGGGTCPNPVNSELALGLSPRGRGNPVSHHSAFINGRSIPAWAGEPTRYCPP